MAEEEKSSKLVEAAFDIQQAYELGYTDFNFYTSIAIPDVYQFEWPEYYLLVWQILTSEKAEDFDALLRFALGLPRGHAKTTFVKVLISWMIVYDKTEFALVLAASDDLAVAIVEDVSLILGSPNIEAIYGRWTDNLSTDAKGHKQGMYHKRPVIILAKGAESSFRGVNFNFRRPDFIFSDDVQTRENDKSEVQRSNLLEWLTGTAWKTIAPHGRRKIVYLGNKYSEECILALLQKNPHWISLVTGAILANGQPLWPQLHSLKSLKESYEHDAALGKVDIWFAEVMNDPISAANSLIPEDIAFEDLDMDTIQPDAAFITIDPAGFRKTSDDNVIAVHYVWNGKGHIVEYNVGIKNPEEIIIEALKLCIFHNCCLIAVEDVAYQQTLQFWLTKYLVEWQMENIHVVPVSPHGRSKEARIRQFVSELVMGNYNLGTPTVRNLFLWQGRLYRFNKKDNKDDILDVSAYGLDVRNEYWHLLTNYLPTQRNLPAARVRRNNTPF